MLNKEADILIAGQEIEQALTVPATPSFLADRFRQFSELQEEHNLLVTGLKTSRMPGEQRRIYGERIKDVRGLMTGLHRMAGAVRGGYEPYSLPENYYVAEFDKEADWNFLIRNRRGIDKITWTAPFLAGALIGGLTNFDIGTMMEIGFKLELISLIPNIIMSSSLEESVPPSNNLNLEFNAPVPVEVIAKYREARDTKFFSRFVIASPDYQLFKETPRTLFNEPVLVGLVAETVGQKIEFDRTNNQRRREWQQEGVPGTKIKNGVGFLIAHWDLEKDRKAAGLNF